MDKNDLATQKIPRCGSCGKKVWKRDRLVFERIGLFQRCALDEVGPLANSLDNALHGDPESLVMASTRGRRSYYEALLEIALDLYPDGWGQKRAVETPESFSDT